jgi:hypothetical protein
MWKVNSNNEENIENKSQGTEKGKGTFDVKFNLTDESNYPIWSKLVLLMSRHHKLAKVQDSVVVFDDTTDSAFFALYLNLSPERQKDVLHLESAQSVWDYFKHAYAGGSYIRLVTGVMELVNFDTNMGKDIRAGLSALLQAVRKTESAAESKSITFENLAVMTFLNKLPPQFSGSAGHLFRKKAATIEDITQELLGEEERLKAGNPQAYQAMFASRAQKKRKISWPQGTNLCKAHNWKEDSCNRCHPDLHPSAKLKASICKDCGTEGHKSSFSPNCSKRGVPGVGKDLRQL